MQADEEGRRVQEIWNAKEHTDTDYLIRALVDPAVRVQAATFLGQLQATESTPALLRLLDASDPTVRFAAARALGWIEADDARPRLREVAVEDDDDGVRSWSVGALGRIGHPDDLDFLLSLLGDPSLQVRGSAALALGELGDRRAMEPLRRARRRLRRSPVEWYWHHKIYNTAISKLKGGRRESDPRGDFRDKSEAPFQLLVVPLVSIVVYYVFKLVIGLSSWWALILAVLIGLALGLVVVLVLATREATSPPPRRRPPPG